MVATVIINTFAGLLILIPLVFALPDPTSLLRRSSNQPVPTIIKDAVGSPGGAFALLIPLTVLGLLCGIGCTTATSRTVWAFARDGAIPGSKYWKMDGQLQARPGAFQRHDVEYGRTAPSGTDLFRLICSFQRLFWRRSRLPDRVVCRPYCRKPRRRTRPRQEGQILPWANWYFLQCRFTM